MIVIRDHLRALPSSGSCLDDTEGVFATAVLQTSELVAPPQDLRLPMRRWRGDAQAETGLNMAIGREASSRETTED